jgi:hypothetical protein
VRLDRTARALAAFDANAPELTLAMETCGSDEAKEVFRQIASLREAVVQAFRSEASSGVPDAFDLDVIRAAVRKRVELDVLR